MGSSEVVGTLRLERNRLEGPAEARRAVATGAVEEVECGLLLRSVGYLSVPVGDVPWDARTHTVATAGGRVVGAGWEGVYATGWVRRGPTGIIGSNISDAQAVGNAVVDDLPILARGPRPTSAGPRTSVCGPDTSLGPRARGPAARPCARRVQGRGTGTGWCRMQGWPGPRARQVHWLSCGRPVGARLPRGGTG